MWSLGYYIATHAHSPAEYDPLRRLDPLLPVPSQPVETYQGNTVLLSEWFQSLQSGDKDRWLLVLF